jgi:hypothetical protein
MRSDLGKTICILVSGRAGTGKTESCIRMKSVFDERGYSTIITNFAYGVKYVAKIMGWDGKKDEAGRELLQGIGKLGRKYDPDCWVRLPFVNVLPIQPEYPYDVLFVDDYRFPNECDFIKKLGEYQVFEIRIVSPERECLKGTPAYDDISETSLPEYNERGNSRYFSVIYNNGTVDELSEKLEELVDVIESKAIRW